MGWVVVESDRMRTPTLLVGRLEGTPEEVRTLPRWIAQKGVPVVPYFPPQMREAPQNPSVPLQIVEAPVKALSLTANGFPAVGLEALRLASTMPSSGRSPSNLSSIRSWQGQSWRGRKAVVVYDAGIQNNPHVALGAAKLSHVLKNSEAAVRIAIIPLVVAKDLSIDEAVTYEATNQGPDDYLARHGEEGPAKLRAEELLTRPSPRTQLKEPALR